MWGGEGDSEELAKVRRHFGVSRPAKRTHFTFGPTAWKCVLQCGVAYIYLSYKLFAIWCLLTGDPNLTA